MRSLVLALLLVGCARSAPPRSPAPVEEPDPLKVQVHRLSNGLTVYLSENRQEPRITAWTVVRAGGARDPDDLSGMAHYLEHMLANKGTTRLGTTDWEAERPHQERIRDLYDALFVETDPDARARLYREIDEEAQAANAYIAQNELKQAWDRLGGRGLNAFTSHEQTTYIVDLPSNRLEQWAMLEADRFTAPVFRNFHTEVETVFEEKNRSLDNASRALYGATSRALWGEHPYGREVLGTVEHLKNPSLSRMEAWYRDWYVPGNMAVVLAGDFDAAEALSLVEASLGQLPAASPPDTPLPAPEPLVGTHRHEVVHQDHEEVRIAWQTVPHGHPDREALVVAGLLLANGASGLIERNLTQPQLVRGAGSWADFRAAGGSLTTWVRPRAGQTVEEAEALVLAQIAELRSGAFPEEALRAIVLNYEVSERREFESNRARVGRMATAFVQDQPWDEARGVLKRVSAVTRDDVVRVAEQYLGDDRVVVVRRRGAPDLPVLKAPALTPLAVNTASRSPFLEAVLAHEAPPLQPQVLVEGRDYLRRETPAGIAWLAENPLDHGLYELSLEWRTGEGHDPELCSAVGLWERAGAGDLDRSAFQEALYGRATRIRASCGRWSVRVSISGPDTHLAEGLALLQQRMAAPVVAEEDLALWVEDRIARRQESKADRDAQIAWLAAYARRGADSLHLTTARTDEELRALTVQGLTEKLAALWSAEHTVYFAGDPDPGPILAALHPEGATYRPLPEVPVEPFVTPAQSRVLLLDNPAVQAWVQVMLPDEVFDPAMDATYSLLGAYLGGSAGLVFQEIREARAMAYSATGSYGPGAEVGHPNLLWGRLESQADKAAEAATLLTKLVTAPPMQEERWARARAGELERLVAQRTGWSGVPYAPAWWERRGYAADPRLELISAVEAHDMAALDRFAARFRDRPVTVVVVGDAGRLDLEALARIGPIERLTVDDLVRY